MGAWNTGEATDLVTAGDWHHVYCRASSGTADSTNVEMLERPADWTTGSANYVLIEAASTDRATQSGIDTAKYRIEVTEPSDPNALIKTSVNYLRFDGIQFILNYTTGTGDFMLRFFSIGVSNDVRVMNCYFKGPDLNASHGVLGDVEANLNLTIENCILTGVSYGYRFGSGTNYLYHCVAYNCDYAVTIDAGLTATNCASFGNSDSDFPSSGATINYCASDDGDGTNAVAASGSDWANEFSDPANGDFTLLNTGNLYQAGTTIAGGPSTDINGDSWASPPSIGADEYGTSAPSSASGPPLGSAIFNSPVFGGILVS